MNSNELAKLFPELTQASFGRRELARRRSALQKLTGAYADRRLVLYLGAGVSRSVGLPNWDELIRSLSASALVRGLVGAAELEHVSEARRWEIISAVQDQVAIAPKSERPVLMLARYVKEGLRGDLQSVIARTLYRSVRQRLFRWKEAKDQKRAASLPTSDLLNAIVGLCRPPRTISGVHAIVNYNFDELVDEVIREASIPCKTVSDGRTVVLSAQLPCYHVHGLVRFEDVLEDPSNHPPRLLFSEDEYHDEYAQPYSWANITQASLLREYTGLFVGLSMKDPNLRRLVDLTHRRFPRTQHYAILTRQPRPSSSAGDTSEILVNLFERMETQAFKKIGVVPIWVDTYDEIPAVIGAIAPDKG